MRLLGFFRQVLVLALLSVVSLGVFGSLQAQEKQEKKKYSLEELRRMGPPHRTLVAPFEYSGGEEKPFYKQNPQESQQTEGGGSSSKPFFIPKPNQLDTAHRTDKEIGKWVMHSLSDMMSVKAASEVDINKQFQEKSLYFSNSGFSQFRSFFAKQGYLKALQSGGFKLGAIVQEIPTLINEGKVKGSYHWLFKVKIMITALPSQANNYKGYVPQSKEYNFNIEVGRASNSPDDSGVVIKSIGL